MPVVLDARVVNGTGGGPDKTILNSPPYLAAEGYRMLCAYMHPPGDPGFEEVRLKAQRCRAPLLPVADRGPWDWRVVSNLLRICRRERVRIWHGHDYKSNALGLLLKRFWPMRLVTTVHGWVKHTRRTPLYYSIDRRCLPHFDAVLCVSEDLHERCLAAGVPPGRCRLLENGIDTRQYSRTLDAREARRQLGLPPDRPLVGAVGRLSEEKGFDVLVRAADALWRDGRDFTLAIAGEGDAGAQLQSLVAELRREDRVRLLGYCPDPATFFQAMDVFAISSLREGLPNALLEAMALECPVVATRVGGIPRLVRNEENGLLVEARDADELAGAIGRLLGDAKLGARLARAGRRDVEREHSFDVRMKKLARVYDALVGREAVA
jgi:glycosyltransferase involved in cell wall biosynthesis